MEMRSRCPECQFLPPLFRFWLPFIREGLHPQRVMQVLMLGADLPANDIPISWAVGGIWWMPVPAAVRWALTPFSHEKSGILTKPSPSDSQLCFGDIDEGCGNSARISLRPLLVSFLVWLHPDHSRSFLPCLSPRSTKISSLWKHSFPMLTGFDFLDKQNWPLKHPMDFYFSKS